MTLTTGWLVGVCLAGSFGVLLFFFFVVSVISHIYPTLWQKKRSQGKFWGRVCSYRGGGGEALEGSLTAFRHSAAVGSDVYISVRKTRDGEIIVYPDKTFMRCCGVPWSVSETIYRFLPRYRPPFFLRYQKACATRGTYERILTLLEVFEYFPKTAIFLDVRSDNVDQKLIDGIARLIVRYKREDITAWGSHNPSMTRALYNKNPFIPLWVNRQRRSTLTMLYYLGLLPFTPIEESVFIIPMPQMVLDKQRGFQVGFLGGWRMWIVDKLLLNRGLIQHLKARGIPTYIFCLNQPHEFRRAFSAGATGVISDFPSVLRDYLDKEEERREKAERL